MEEIPPGEGQPGMEMMGWERRRAQRATRIWERQPFQEQLKACAACSVLPSPQGQLFSAKPAQPKYRHLLGLVWAL